MTPYINHLFITASQTAVTYSQKLIDTVQKNKIVIVALLAMGCLAAYLYKRHSERLLDKTLQPINLDEEVELKTPVKAKNVFGQKIEQDSVEFQRKQEELQVEQKKSISEGVKEWGSINQFEHDIETVDDLRFLLNERCSFASEEAIRGNDPDYLQNDVFLNPLFLDTGFANRLEKKLNLKFIEFAVRNVKVPMNRMYLAHAFHSSNVSLFHSNLTKDEIIEFLGDIEDSDLPEQYGPSFSNLRSYSSRFFIDEFRSISMKGEGGPLAENFKEMNIKRIDLFKEFFVDYLSEENVQEFYQGCLKCHDPELLHEFFALKGYKYPILYVPSRESELLKPQQRKQWDDFKKKELLQYLSGRQQNYRYNDYNRLRATIAVLINYKIIELELFEVTSIHDLIIKEFQPDNFVVLNMLESDHCDLQMLMSLARKVPCDFKWEFQHLMRRAGIAIENPNRCEGSPRACQFLHDHFMELEDDVKADLIWALKLPEAEVVKQTFFNELGL